MGSLSGNYDPNAEAPKGFDVFPAGNYPLEMVEGEIKPTKAGTGKLFKHKFRVTSGDYEGRLIFGQFNLLNPNPQAQEIGQGEFAVLREAVGVPDPDEPEDMFFKEFVAVVKIKPPKDGYDAQNQVNWSATYKLLKGQATPAGKTPVTSPPAANDNQPAPGTGRKPWPARAA